MTTEPRSSRLIPLVPLLGGLLVGLCFPPYGLSFLAWVALVPLAWCWIQPALPRAAYWSAFAGGVTMHLLSLSWMRTSYSDGTVWFGPNTDVWLVLGVVFAAFFLIMFHYGVWLARVSRLPMAIVLPVVWVSYELVRTYASMAGDQTGFPWCKLGTTQADGRILVQVADIGGVYLVSCVIAMVNGAILDTACWLRVGEQGRARRSAVGPVAAILMVAVSLLYGHWRGAQCASEFGPVVCLMPNTDLPPYLSQERLANSTSNRPIDDQYTQTCKPPFDILLWPELAFHHKLVDVTPSVQLASRHDVPRDVRATAGPHLGEYPGYVREALARCAAEVDATLIIGCERLECDGESWKRFNSVVCVDPTVGVAGCYDKCHPVPWNEFMPFAGETIDADSQMPYQQGSSPVLLEMQTHGSRSKYTYSIACCYDLCFASHFRSAIGRYCREGGVDFFVHCGAEGQDPTGVLRMSMMRAARLRAIETRRAFVRNVSDGASGIIDGNGDLYALAPERVLSRPYNIGAVPIDRRTSMYASWGDLPMAALCLIAAITCLMKSRTAAR